MRRCPPKAFRGPRRIVCAECTEVAVESFRNRGARSSAAVCRAGLFKVYRGLGRRGMTSAAAYPSTPVLLVLAANLVQPCSTGGARRAACRRRRRPRGGGRGSRPRRPSPRHGYGDAVRRLELGPHVVQGLGARGVRMDRGWAEAREEAAQPGACSLDESVRLVFVRDADGRYELAERELVLGVEEPTQNVREWKAGIRGSSQHTSI